MAVFGNVQQYNPNEPGWFRATGEAAHVGAEKLAVTKGPSALGTIVSSAAPESAVAGRIGMGLAGVSTGLSGLAELVGAVTLPFGTAAMQMAIDECACGK